MCVDPCDLLINHMTKAFREYKYKLDYKQIHAVCYSIRITEVDLKKTMRVFFDRHGYLSLSSVTTYQPDYACILIKEGSIWGII